MIPTMERSDRHNPRLDEELKHEIAPLTHGAGIESHSREDLRQETPLPEEGAPDPSARPDVPAPEGTLSPAEANQRAELARVLATVRFPAPRERLFQAALDEHAPDDVIDRLRRLPVAHDYRTVQEVWVATGGATEGVEHT
jgi:hypothetical protein